MKNEKLKIKIKKDISLARYTTFKIGGRARYFLIAKSREDIIGGIQWAKKKKLPFFVLGGGSNLLVSDKGYNGLVVQTKSQKSKVKITSQKSEVFEVDAGMPLKSFIKLSMEQGLSGLEWAVGIPGITVGGAIRGNAGAFGSRMSDVVKEVEVIEIKNLKLKTLKNKDCKFNCKDSVFKKNRTLVILSAVLVLKKKNKQEVLKLLSEGIPQKEISDIIHLSKGQVSKIKAGIVEDDLLSEKGKITVKGENFLRGN